MQQNFLAHQNNLKAIISEEGPIYELFGLTRDHLREFAAFGSQLFEQGQIDDAQTIFHGLVAADPTDFSGYAGLGAVALEKEDFQGAAEQLIKACELSPENPILLANLGEALLGMEHWEESRAAFDKALTFDPERKNPDLNRARAIVEIVNPQASPGEQDQR